MSEPRQEIQEKQQGPHQEWEYLKDHVADRCLTCPSLTLTWWKLCLLSSSLSLGGTCDLIPTKWMWQRWHNVHYYITQDCTVCVARVSPLPLGFEEAGCHESYSYKEFNVANNHISSESRPFPIKPPDENSVLANILLTTLWDPKQKISLSCSQTLDSQKLWDNQCVFI